MNTLAPIAVAPWVDVRFLDLAHDQTLVGAVHFWVARFEAMSHLEVRSARIAITSSGRRHTAVRSTIALADGRSQTVTSTHPNPYVAVSDVFRRVHRGFVGESRTSRARDATQRR